MKTQQRAGALERERSQLTTALNTIGEGQLGQTLPPEEIPQLEKELRLSADAARREAEQESQRGSGAFHCLQQTPKPPADHVKPLVHTLNDID